MRFTVFTHLLLWLTAVHAYQERVPGDAKAAPQPPCLAAQRQTIQLLTMLPYPNAIPQFNPSWTQGPDILPALFLAEDQINNRTDILPCHYLELVPVDGGCDIAATTATSTAIGLLREEDMTRVVGVIGPGCSRSALQTAHTLNQPEIELIQLHDAGSPLLENRDEFTNALGILGSTKSFVDLSLALMRKSGWQNIAILFESNRVFFRSTKETFVASLNSDVNVLFTSPVYTTFYPLDGIRSSLARIVFVFTSTSHSTRIMCLAYHMGMVYPAYQWVLVSKRLDDYITENSSLSDEITFYYDRRLYTCLLEQLLNVALEGTFLLSYQLFPVNSNRNKLANTTFETFVQLYEERAKSCNVTPTYWAYNLYDAVWAWASVLHRMIDKHGGIFDNFVYGNKTLSNMILDEFYSRDFEFEGMSGTISFNSSTGFYDRPSNLYQIINGQERHVAYNNGTSIVKLLPLETIMDLVRTVGLVDTPVIVVFAMIQFVEFFVVVVLHILTVVYRKEPSVRASSPNLSHFAFAGIYILIFALLLFEFTEIRDHAPSVSGAICQFIWGWAFPIGFTLTIGTVTVRTWRLYRIFTHYLDPGKLISNTALVTMLVILLSIDIIIATIWSALDPLRLVTVEYTVPVGSAIEIVLHRACRSQYGPEGVAWWVVIMTIRIALMVVLVVLSLLTRNIPNKTFGTSSLRVFSYTFSAVFCLGFFLYYFFVFLSYNDNVDFSVLCTLISVVVLLYASCVFVPPLAPIIRDKVKEARNYKKSLV